MVELKRETGLKVWPGTLSGAKGETGTRESEAILVCGTAGPDGATRAKGDIMKQVSQVAGNDAQLGQRRTGIQGTRNHDNWPGAKRRT
jgi:hypothetical protein